jgi:hypothetical protein
MESAVLYPSQRDHREQHQYAKQNITKILKSLISGAFCAFRGKKHIPFTIAPFPRPYGLELATLANS